MKKLINQALKYWWVTLILLAVIVITKDHVKW
jgi:hypothetical protein